MGVRRDNDLKKEVVQNRLNVYHSQLSSIVQQFQGKLQMVDGTASVDEVTTNVFKCLTAALDVRVDPADGKAYTFDGFKVTHTSYQLEDMRRYWEEAMAKESDASSAATVSAPVDSVE